MNVKNNKRKKESQMKIKNTFFELLKKKELNKIKVSEICQMAEINRSTFYANYLDVFDLADKIFAELSREVESLFDTSKQSSLDEKAFLSLLTHVKENKEIYGYYFALGYENKKWTFTHFFVEQYASIEPNIDYRIEFFRGGFNAIIKKWIENGCKETPEKMCEILCYEYRGRF